MHRNWNTLISGLKARSSHDVNQLGRSFYVVLVLVRAGNKTTMKQFNHIKFGKGRREFYSVKSSSGNYWKRILPQKEIMHRSIRRINSTSCSIYTYSKITFTWEKGCNCAWKCRDMLLRWIGSHSCLFPDGFQLISAQNTRILCKTNRLVLETHRILPNVWENYGNRPDLMNCL